MRNEQQFVNSLYNHHYAFYTIVTDVRYMQKIVPLYTDEEIMTTENDEIYRTAISKGMFNDTASVKNNVVHALNNYRRFLGEAQ